MTNYNNLENTEKWNSIFANASSHPWESAVDHNIVDWFSKQNIVSGTVLELGCGADPVNAVWLQKRGLDVTAIDISDVAIISALSKTENSRIKLQATDILKNSFEENNFDYVVDRGCFHTYDFDGSLRHAFAKSVSKVLRPNGIWLSISGRDFKSMSADTLSKLSALNLSIIPHQLSVEDIVSSIDPYLSIVSINSTTMNLYNKTVDWPSRLVISKKNKSYSPVAQR